jgi:hypothetical protein
VRPSRCEPSLSWNSRWGNGPADRLPGRASLSAPCFPRLLTYRPEVQLPRRDGVVIRLWRSNRTIRLPHRSAAGTAHVGPTPRQTCGCPVQPEGPICSELRCGGLGRDTGDDVRPRWCLRIDSLVAASKRPALPLAWLSSRQLERSDLAPVGRNRRAKSVTVQTADAGAMSSHCQQPSRSIGARPSAITSLDAAGMPMRRCLRPFLPGS